MNHNAQHDEHEAKLAELLQLIHERENFVISSHARPDGDAIGSSLGLMHLLEALGKRAVVCFADPIPPIYRGLPGVERILHKMPAATPDAAILLECDRFERTGFTAEDFAAIPFVFNIDHHLSGKSFAHFNWIDPQCAAVGAMVYDLAVLSGVQINCNVATCLYTAVLTDTGSFTYSSTRASTFALAEHLVSCGANPNRIAQAVYLSNPASKFHLLGAALRNLHVQAPLAWSWVTLSDIARAGAAVEDCEGVVNYLIGIEGVEAAVFLRELPQGEGVRLSVRSKGIVDVARVADSLGGGGHHNASGCTLAGPLADATGLILDRLRAALPASPLPERPVNLC